MIEFLTEHALLKNAAEVAKTFRLDPVKVLNASRFEWQVRIAAHNHIAAEEKKQAAAMKAKGGRGR